MKSTPKLHLLSGSLLLAAALATVGNLAAASIVDFDFDTAAEFNNNFQIERGANLQWINSTAKVGNSTTNSEIGVAIYDTNPGTSGYDNNTFLTETISANFFSNYYGSNTRMGLISRVQSDGTGMLVYFYPQSTTSFQVRFAYNADLDTGIGTSWHVDSLTGLTAYNINDITLTLHQTSGVDPTFQLIVQDGTTEIYDSGAIALTATEAYNGAGAVGFFNQNTGNRVNYTRSFMIIPEPSSMAMLAAGAAFLVFGRRRKV
ncbi:MAG: PEP-CTERM sorting domain-containing protein [Chthoniobacterales bacterium]